MRHLSIVKRSSHFDATDVTTGSLVLAMMAIAWVMTWEAGGTYSPIHHLFYVPVLIVAIRWGFLPGALLGIMAGVASGPLMPLNSGFGIEQQPDDWVVRAGFFIGAGVLTGALAQTMRNRYERVHQFHREAIRTLVRTIDAKSSYTAQHSERVAELARMIAQQLRLPQQHCNDIYWAGLLHDIGKLTIPASVLEKPDQLTEDEWEIVKQHPVDSESFLQDVEEFRPYLPGIRHHHERFAGDGYPDGLANDDIPFDARVLAVADALEAMTAARPYRDGLSIKQALDEIERNAGIQFDPVVAQATVEAIRNGFPLPIPMAEVQARQSAA